MKNKERQGPSILATPRPSTSIPLSNVTFDGNNFREWSTMLRVCLDSQRLWGHLTGHASHPSVPVRPTEPAIRADGAPLSDETEADYTASSEQYMFDLSDYEDWAAAEARATKILLGSMKVDFAMNLASLSSTRVMWDYATKLYQPQSHALYISVLELASSIRQQDSSVDAFYRQLTDVGS
jgi:hypothetical protein